MPVISKENAVVLAYSGGLDTTYCAVWLGRVKGLEVHAVTVNTGGFDDDEISAMEERALAIGAASFTCIDVREQYYRDCIRFMIYGNVLKNGSYPLSVSSERIVQAQAIAGYALENGIRTVAHGSTGAGNDQVRFDMILQHLLPDAEIITPIRDNRLSREAEIGFLKEHGVSYDFAKAAYSVNKGLWGTSVGGKETLTSDTFLPEEAWPTQVTETQPLDISLGFTNGEVSSLNGKQYDSPVDLIARLQRIAQPFGIGRDIHVGDTIIGIKGRVGFEAAAPVIIIKAHHLLEKHVLTKSQLYWKDQLSLWYGTSLHEGHMLDPVMRDMESFFESSQKCVTGEVFITLHPYRFVLNGITSPHDLMSAKFGSYGEMNNSWTGDDVKGFTRIAGNQSSIYHQVNQSAAYVED
jgi:argininosuccinate synthase